MPKMDVANIKKLRDLTGAGVLEIKQALEKYANDFDKTKAALMEKGKEKASKKSERDVKDGLVFSYIHTGGKVGSLILMACETDFVAKTDDFTKLCKEVAMQVCSNDYTNIEEVLADEYIRDGSKKVRDLITETIAKVGENIELKSFVKYSVK